eukprot:gene14138-15631_t
MPIVKATGTTDKSKTQKSLYSFFCKVDDRSKNENSTKTDAKKDDEDVKLEKKDTTSSLQSETSHSPPTFTAKEVTPDSNSSKFSESLQRNSETKTPRLRLEDEDEQLKDSDDENVVVTRKRKLGKTAGAGSAKKQKSKKSLLDSDEEWSANEQSEDEDDDYNASPAEEDEMSVSEDSFIVDDDDEDDMSRKRKSNKKASTPKLSKPSAGKKSSSLPPKGKSVSTSATKSVPTPKYSMIVDSTPSKGASSPFPNIVTPSGPHTPNIDGDASYPATPSSNIKLFQLPEGVVGQGSHDHNSFDFLKPENRRDADGNKMDSPNYNPRTLKVPPKYLSEQTPAMQQWWQFKSQNMDTVLFFKVGKFYELFHMDADIAFSEIDLIYMKGSKAHSGFPEVSYGKFASILVSKGYRVARIEQTETPDMLKERNESAGKGKKDKVVARELCAIMTKGTRTYCHLDDLTLLDDANSDAVSTSLLVCIKELSVTHSLPSSQSSEDDASIDAVVEYGITAIDTVIGKVTLAQFQDNRQRSRLRAFLARYIATEVLLQHQGHSEETLGAVKLICPKASLEYLRGSEMPENPMDVILSIFKSHYFPLKLEKKIAFTAETIPELIEVSQGSWPSVLHAVMRGLKDNSSKLVILALGGALWQMRRSLIDYEVLSMGKVYGYVPADEDSNVTFNQPVAMEVVPTETVDVGAALIKAENKETESENQFEVASSQKRMILDEVSLTNLEILVNNYDRSEVGSLWHFINRCKTIGGKRLLHSWLCHPLYQLEDIQRRSEAIEELLSSSLQSITDEVRKRLKGIPDLERLLIRVHSNGIKRKGVADHPDSRAVMFESSIYTMRKIRDFADILSGFENLVNIIELFQKYKLKSSLLRFALHGSNTFTDERGLIEERKYFPLQEIKQSLSYFRTIFDEKQAKKDGNIKPRPGINPDYDSAMQEIESITQYLEVDYLKEMKKLTGISDIKYFGNGKDRYQLEVPMNLTKNVPSDWMSKSQKKTHRRYRTKIIEEKLQELVQYEEMASNAQKDTLRSIFEKFDSSRRYWERAAASISFLDALLSLATISSLPGYVIPQFQRKDANVGPVLQIDAGRHPMLEYTLAQRNGNSYIPNDGGLGGVSKTDLVDEYAARMLLLSGPNMGGKSTLLRQTCLIVIL